MGSPANEPGRDSTREAQHPVEIRPFLAGKYLVTREEYAEFAHDTHRPAVGDGYVYLDDGFVRQKDRTWVSPGFIQSDRDPVVCVSWNDAVAYVEWLAAKTGKPYRLLTEAEWEYAARAGSTTPYFTGASISPSQANFNLSVGKTSPVGSYPPNAFGLYDMAGNVNQWTADCYGEVDLPTDGSANTKGDCTRRMVRGGSWRNEAALLRVALRDPGPPTIRSIYLGFRVARSR
jgi:formylglycine-generating enzyme required for sulfatase activity